MIYLENWLIGPPTTTTETTGAALTGTMGYSVLLDPASWQQSEEDVLYQELEDKPMTTLPEMFVITERFVRLLLEVRAWHRDPKSADYNGCEKSPCRWCQEVQEALDKAKWKSTV